LGGPSGSVWREVSGMAWGADERNRPPKRPGLVCMRYKDRIGAGQRLKAGGGA
jgi:hypothetical protein